MSPATAKGRYAYCPLCTQESPWLLGYCGKQSSGNWCKDAKIGATVPTTINKWTFISLAASIEPRQKKVLGSRKARLLGSRQSLTVAQTHKASHQLRSESGKRLRAKKGPESQRKAQRRRLQVGCRGCSLMGCHSLRPRR